jgi:hypothetical protein
LGSLTQALLQTCLEGQRRFEQLFEELDFGLKLTEQGARS